MTTHPTAEAPSDGLIGLADRLRRLVIMDEVGSDNPLGREAAEALTQVAARIQVLEGERDSLKRHLDLVDPDWRPRGLGNPCNYPACGCDPDAICHVAIPPSALEAENGRTPEELESLLSLALGALEPFARTHVLAIEFTGDSLHSTGSYIDGPTKNDFRQASQVIAQIKGGQESMASSSPADQPSGIQPRAEG